uniref:NAD(P)-binding domain-containing protein n=1 Tax=Prevotella sp. TaxID=59823 RepID=UPI0040275608
MKIAIIGAGAMGGAMADGFIKSGAVKPADISVANPTAKKLEHFALQGGRVSTDHKPAA